MDHPIPVVRHTSYARAWLQPHRFDILVDCTHAVMAPNAFVKLNAKGPVYIDDCFPGQMWRQAIYVGQEDAQSYWKLIWCENLDLGARRIVTSSRIILIA